MEPIYLTNDEQKIFSALPVRLKEGWEVTGEQQVLKDDAAHRAMRLQLLRLRDTKLTDFVRRGRDVADVDALVALITATDLTGVNDADLAELCFALGPVPLTGIIGSLLRQAKTDDDLEGIQAIAVVRRSLITAQTPSPR